MPHLGYTPGPEAPRPGASGHPPGVLFRLGFFAAALLTTAACGGQASVGGPDSPLSAPRQPSASPGPDLGDAILWLSFDEESLDFDGRKTFPDALEGAFDGRVLIANGGKVEMVPGAPGRGSAAAFPGKCAARHGCPRAMVEVAADPALDPGDADFEYGASVWLAANETTTGSNIVQKGRFATSDSLWKLQVDSSAGHPSCVVRSGAELVRVGSEVSIADGDWHRIVCRKDDNALSIEVDGIARSSPGRIGSVTSRWPVRVGAPGVGDEDDQFHGLVDDVYLRISPGD